VAGEFGYAGKILRVDLSSGSITYVPTVNYADRFLGGRGIAAKIYWDEVSPNVKAFDPENRLIFVTGPLAGFTRLAGSRSQICGKSPATIPELFCYSNVGGSWGAELKFSGYDGTIIQGKSDKPVYLFLQDRIAEIRDASALWGKSSVETREILKGELGSSVKVLATGPAGENLVTFATVLADDDSSGSSGFGAVMGSKRLKAIAVRGSGKVVAANLERLREVTEYVHKLAKDAPMFPPIAYPPPKKRHACYGCIAGCGRTFSEVTNGERGKVCCQSGSFYREPAGFYYKEWTEVPFHATRLCDKYGLDTMVIEPMILWILRCTRAGILTDENTGIPISKFGSLEFIEGIIKKISLREGFGDILAQGISSAADLVGSGAKELIGDLIFPKTGQPYYYDPRMYITTGLFYAMEPRVPIQHLHEISLLMLHWLEWNSGAAHAYVSSDLTRAIAKSFWGSEIAADFSTYEGKALAAKKIQDRQYAKESLILCDHSWPIAHVKYSADHMGDPTIESKILSAVTGKVVDEEGLYRIGERVFNLQRAILAREGHRGREADSLPEFTYTTPLRFQKYNAECLLPGEGGKVITRKGAVVDRNKFEDMKDEYYNLRGWDVTSGLQTMTKLEQLELRDIAQNLAQSDLIA